MEWLSGFFCRTINEVRCLVLCCEVVEDAAQVGEVAIGEPGCEHRVNATQVGQRCTTQDRSSLLRYLHLDGPAVAFAGLAFDQATRNKTVNKSCARTFRDQHSESEISHPKRTSRPLELEQHVVILKGDLSIANEIGIEDSRSLTSVAK